MNRDGCQYVFTDTLGSTRPTTGWGSTWTAWFGASINDVDAAVLVVEPIPKPGAPELQLIQRIRHCVCPAC